MTASRMTPEGLEEIRKRVERLRFLGQEEGRVRVTVHMGTCGIASGAGDVRDALVAEVEAGGLTDVHVTSSGCIGLCSKEPLITVEVQDDEPIVYHSLDASKIRKIFYRHIRNEQVVVELALMRGRPVNEEPPPERSRLKGVIPHVSEVPYFALQKSWVLRNRGLIDPDSIEDYIWRGGYRGAARALLQMQPQEIIGAIKESGLRGRGGGGFPTGMKWEFCATAKGTDKYVLCNADEGDPGAFMDRSVLEGDPHAVLEGMIVAARAIGAHRGYIYCRAEYPLAVEKLNHAIRQANDLGLLGDDILGSGFDLKVEVYRGAGAFVCGEETALMASIEGRRGTPRPRPPFPAVRGLWDSPTVLNNVETYASVGRIMELGADAYSAMGTETSKGTKVFALTGKVQNVGLVEVPMGTSLGTIVFDIGGGVPEGKRFKAIQLGGPSGGCLPASQLNVRTDYEEINRAGAIMGSGGLIVMDEDTCMVDMARYFMDFCQDESCGKCTPCRVGTKRMLEILERICQGSGRSGDPELLASLGESIRDTALCGLGQTAANPVLSTLRHFGHEYTAHIEEKRCPAVVCSDLFNSPCQHACPLGMDIPAYVALVREGRLDEAYEVLTRTNPLPAVCGRVCPHPCESKCRRGQVDEPVAIARLKRYITDHATRSGQQSLPVTREERIAVVGSGPAGLSASLELRRRGYHVVVFEEMENPGGMLRYGIPPYRLPREVLDAEIRDILDTGVQLRTGVRIGRDVSLSDLKSRFAAIFLAIGAHQSIPLQISGETSPDVVGAVEFLRQYNQGRNPDVGERVAVIGGGDLAMDAARTARRLGARSVAVYYRRRREDMPAIPRDIEEALQEGIRIEEMVTPARILLSEKRVTGLKLRHMSPGEFDRSGRRKTVPMKGAVTIVAVDQIIHAIGQRPALDDLSESPRDLTSDGLLLVDHRGRLAGREIWAGGDATSGPATVVQAIRSGLDAARSMDERLRTRTRHGSRTAPTKPAVTVPGIIPTEIVEQSQTRPHVVPPSARVRDFTEVEKTYTHQMALSESSRCLRCDLCADQE